MGFCNSCGRPMGRNDYGTNEDGSPNMDYCKDCFQNGEFTEPDITINEMIIRHAKRMRKDGILILMMRLMRMRNLSWVTEEMQETCSN